MCRVAYTRGRSSRETATSRVHRRATPSSGGIGISRAAIIASGIALGIAAALGGGSARAQPLAEPAALSPGRGSPPAALVPLPPVQLPPAPLPPAAAPLAGATEDRARAVQCLATAIAYEAGFEPVEGRQAVAEVILNRVRAPFFPKTVCGVVFAGSSRRTGCQFSFTCDGSLRRALPARVLAEAHAIAVAALDGTSPARVAGAAWYHADYVSPYWAPSLVRVTKIGAHIFYRAPGAADRGPGQAGYRAVGEPVIAALTPVPMAGAATVGGGLPPAAGPARPKVFAPWGLAPAR